MGFGNKDQGPKKPRSLYSVKASWTDNIDWNTTMYIIWCILVLSLVFLGSNHFKYEKELLIRRSWYGLRKPIVLKLRLIMELLFLARRRVT